MSEVFVGFGDYALEGVDDEYIQFVFDIAVTIAKLDADSEIGLVITTDDHMQKLNAKYRGKDKTTNVLSFGYLETLAPVAGATVPERGLVHDTAPVQGAAEQFVVQPGDENYLGDIYVSRPEIMREAKEMGISDRDRFLQLFVHGILHLAGMDHGNDVDAEAMEALEDQIIEKSKE